MNDVQVPGQGSVDSAHIQVPGPGSVDMAHIQLPGPGSVDRAHIQTPISSTLCNKSKTLRFPKTPLSRRLTASTRARQGPDQEDYDYTGLLMKTWKIYSLSPLYKFQSSKVSLKKYARSLDVAFSQENMKCFNTDTCDHEKSSFSLYEGLNFHEKDAKSVQIQVTVKSESARAASIVLNAFLICVDLDTSPVPENLVKHFTYYPVILVSGNKSRSDILLTWLEEHFDCRSEPVTFSDSDLRWMLASWSNQDTSAKSFPILLQYSLTDVCDGISTIDCKFEAAFCKQLWERLNGGSSALPVINELEVNHFVTALEEHLQYTMHILFSKLSLSEVGTSVAYVSGQGKLKLFSKFGVFPALHLICEILNDRFLDIV